MDHELEIEFQRVRSQLEADFGEGLDVKSILFLIGVNELGRGYKDFSKSEKIDLMHVAICTLLEPYGFYTFEGADSEGWPHFILNKKLPALSDREQQELLKRGIINYFTA